MDLKDTSGTSHDCCSKQETKKRASGRCKSILVEWLTEFSLKSSIQGFQYLALKKLSITEKLFWVITFAVSIALSCFYIMNVWDKWNTSPVIVSFSAQMVPVGQVPFPSVTICPQRKALRSVYNFSAEYQYYVNVLEPIAMRGELNATTRRKIELLENVGHICDEGFLSTVLDRRWTDDIVIRDIIKVSPKIKDVFHKCTWRGQDTPCEELFSIVLTNEGLCFNFNSLSRRDIFNDKEGMFHDYLGNSRPIKGWHPERGYDDNVPDPYPRRGREFGSFPDLGIILKDNLNDRDSMCNTMRSGYREIPNIHRIIFGPLDVIVVSPSPDRVYYTCLTTNSGTCGFPRDVFLQRQVYLQHPADRPKTTVSYTPVLPEKETAMALTFHMISSDPNLKSYPADIRQCYFQNERKLNLYRTYSESNCKFECRTINTYKTCKCLWYNMPSTPNQKHYCTIESSPCYYNAEEEIAIKQMNKHKKACNCLPACNSIEYGASVVQSDFDLKTYLKNFWKLKNDTSIEDNSTLYSRLELFFKAPSFVSMQRTELFGLTDFLANCGGLVGLFLGFSFLSVAEIFFFLTLRLCCMLRQDRVTDKSEPKKGTCCCKQHIP